MMKPEILQIKEILIFYLLELWRRMFWSSFETSRKL